MASSWIVALLAASVRLIALLPAGPQDQAPSHAPCRDAADCNVTGSCELSAGRG